MLQLWTLGGWIQWTLTITGLSFLATGVVYFPAEPSSVDFIAKGQATLDLWSCFVGMGNSTFRKLHHFRTLSRRPAMWLVLHFLSSVQLPQKCSHVTTSKHGMGEGCHPLTFLLKYLCGFIETPQKKDCFSKQCQSQREVWVSLQG